MCEPINAITWTAAVCLGDGVGVPGKWCLHVPSMSNLRTFPHSSSSFSQFHFIWFVRYLFVCLCERFAWRPSGEEPVEQSNTQTQQMINFVYWNTSNLQYLFNIYLLYLSFHTKRKKTKTKTKSELKRTHSGWCRRLSVAGVALHRLHRLHRFGPKR